MPEDRKRQTAYKVWIKDLITSKFITKEGWDPNYVEFDGKQISRVNIIASVIDKFENDDKTYCSLTLDDGSADIRAKAWKEDSSIISNLNVGETVMIIGKVKEYNNEIYLIPEIIKQVIDPTWLQIRKLELGKIYGNPIKETQELPQETEQTTTKEEPKEIEEQRDVVEEEIIDDDVTENSRQKILNSIEKQDSEEGVEKVKIINETQIAEDEASKIIDNLIKEGEIYEIKPGRYKLLE